ncbi:fatty acid desaturase [Calditrichota bacterium]
MDNKDLQQFVRKYTVPDVKKSILQLLDSFLPYIAFWALMILSIKGGYPYWVTFIMILCATIFHIRIFIIFHDCCHQSFFESRVANRVIGTILGVLTFTSYESWGDEHLTHHSTVADLDRRGTGDIWTMTVNEYRNASKQQKFLYRLYRHPLVMFGLGPIWVFFIYNRFFYKGTSARIKNGVVITNLALLVILLGMTATVGLKTYLLIQIPIMYLGGVIGIWLFYVQHQFDPTHWYPHEDWDFLTAALNSSSYYKLPKVLQWISGNIGLHHVHHVNARIPNYNLQACLNETPLLQKVAPMTLLDSFKSIQMHLWDENQKKLVSFRSQKISR